MTAAINPLPTRSKSKNALAIVTYVGDNIQERSTRVFIRSVRERGGKYKDALIYIML